MNTQSTASLLSEQVNSTSKVKLRIEWIDVAKAIAIILVIVGHSVAFGGVTRNLIFSFHMPLFFILAGYTKRTVSDLAGFKKVFIHSFKRLIVPLLFIEVFALIYQFAANSDHSLTQVFHYAKIYGERLLWASGVVHNGHLALGMPWFIISLFWGNLIFYVVTYCFKKIYWQLAAFIALAGLGIILGKNDIWLIQNFDVTCVCALFIYFGWLYKKYEFSYSKYEKYILLFALAFAVFYCLRGSNIELANRVYSVGKIVNAVLNSYIVIIICKQIVEMKKDISLLLFIGYGSLVVFYVHHLDWITSSMWRSNIPEVACLTRVIVDISLSLAICLLLQWYKARKNETSRVIYTNVSD